MSRAGTLSCPITTSSCGRSNTSRLHAPIESPGSTRAVSHQRLSSPQRKNAARGSADPKLGRKAKLPSALRLQPGAGQPCRWARRSTITQICARHGRRRHAPAAAQADLVCADADDRSPSATTPTSQRRRPESAERRVCCRPWPVERDDARSVVLCRSGAGWHAFCAPSPIISAPVGTFCPAQWA